MDPFNDVWVMERIIRPFLDIAILSFLFYQMYKLIAQTRAVQLFKGALFLLLIYAVAFFFHLDTLLWIINSLATVIVIIIAIVFQPELRAMFTRIGRGEFFRLTPRANAENIETVINAMEVLAAIEIRFKITVDEAKAFGIVTVKDLNEAVKKYIKEKNTK